MKFIGRLLIALVVVGGRRTGRGAGGCLFADRDGGRSQPQTPIDNNAGRSPAVTLRSPAIVAPATPPQTVSRSPAVCRSRRPRQYLFDQHYPRPRNRDRRLWFERLRACGAPRIAPPRRHPISGDALPLLCQALGRGTSPRSMPYFMKSVAPVHAENRPTEDTLGRCRCAGPLALWRRAFAPAASDGTFDTARLFRSRCGARRVSVCRGRAIAAHVIRHAPSRCRRWVSTTAVRRICQADRSLTAGSRSICAAIRLTDWVRGRPTTLWRRCALGAVRDMPWSARR